MDMPEDQLDGGPVVDMTPELASRLAEAVDAPTRRTSRVLQVLLVVVGAALATWAAAQGRDGLRVLALVLLALVVVLFLADAGRRRRAVRVISAQERVAVRYDEHTRTVRFPLAGTQHPVEAFRSARESGDVLVLTRADGTRTPVPSAAMPEGQRAALLAALAR